MAIGPMMQRELERYGLGSLAPWLAEMIISNASPEQLELELYQRPEFKARFPAIEVRNAANLPPISIEEYLAYENQVRNLSTMWDIPVDQDEINTLIGLNVSTPELEQRFSIAVGIVYESPEEDRLEARRLYGITDGQMAKYWMDPNREMGKLQQQYVASRIAGSAVRSGFGQLNVEEAERIGSLGLSPEAATQGFGELYRNRELFSNINQTEDEITREEQLALLAGNAIQTEAVQKKQATRVAEFGGGGEFAAGGEGFKGVGSAKS